MAIDNRTDKLIAVATRPHLMEGKGHPNITTMRPLRQLIADFNAAELMIRGLVKKNRAAKELVLPAAHGRGHTLRLDRSGDTRRTRLLSEHADGRDVYMLYEPMAAALGIGLDVEAPKAT